MIEKILSFKRGPRGKKYTVEVIDRKGKTRTISFGASAYEHYRDSTPLKIWKHKDHNDKRRRRLYFTRHSGLPTKRKSIDVEVKKSKGRYNAKILSHQFLW